MAKRKVVRARDLSESGLTDGRILYCNDCGAEYSATRGDYWDMPLDKVLTCCEAPMRLVYKRTVYVDVK